MLASVGARPRERRHFASRPSAVAYEMGQKPRKPGA